MTDGVAPAITAHNLDAERALLGLLLDSPQYAESCGIRPGDLDVVTGHDLLLSTILDVYDEHRTVDPVLLADQLRRRDQLNRIGDEQARGVLYVAELAGVGARALPQPQHYARLIREATIRRRLWEVGTRLAQAAETEGDVDAVLDRASDLALQLGVMVDEPLDGDTPIPGLGLVADFVREPSPPHSWVLPGIVERGDRVMLIAGEGAGKSVLARQVCTMLAAGRHPDAPRVAITPRRTLLIDLENPVDLVRRNLRGLVGQVWERDLDVADRAWKWTRPGGLDLRGSADRQLLARVIEQVRPDLVAIGPVYKAYGARSGDNHESGPAEFGRAIDQLRERYGCAFWIEHHAPKADSGGRRGDPIGSSYWLRWPEFGLVLRLADNAEANVYELGRFRGDRDVRAFPERLLKTGNAPGAWPWTADYEPDTKAALFDAIDEDQADQLPDPAHPGGTA
jgi:hypothetical protein